MTPTNDLTCRHARRLLQRLLDRHWTRPLPVKLRRHLRHCRPCRDWKPLFQYEPAEVPVLPADFAIGVVSRYHWEERRRAWQRRASWFAAAAAVLLTLFLGKLLPTGTEQPASSVAQARPNLTSLVAEVSRGIETLPQRWKLLSPPSVSWPDITFDVPTPDPLDVSLPPLRSLGDTLQEAVVPLRRPAREVYQRVIEIIDEPELQKWYQTVRKGMS